MAKKKVAKKAAAAEETEAAPVADAPSLEERMAASRKIQEDADNHPDAARPRRNRLEDRKRANAVGHVPGVNEDDDGGDSENDVPGDGSGDDD